MFIIIEVYEILQILRKFVEFLSRKQEAVVATQGKRCFEIESCGIIIFTLVKKKSKIKYKVPYQDYSSLM